MKTKKGVYDGSWSGRYSISAKALRCDCQWKGGGCGRTNMVERNDSNVGEGRARRGGVGREE